VSRKPVRHSTVPASHPPHRAAVPPPPPRTSPPYRPPQKQVARIIDQSDSSLLDVLDNLLNRGVVLNADIILALANVDLVYLRLSALLCAADRVLQGDEG
jgi:Gas vesicle protein